MALPVPDDLAAIVRVEPDTTDAFLSKLSSAMGDAEQVKNGFRSNGSFSFYIPGLIVGFTVDEIRKAVKEAGWLNPGITQVHGYMPTNQMIDFRNADPTMEGVTGPSTFAWVHVNVKRNPDFVPPETPAP